MKSQAVDFPAAHARVFKTDAGTPYLQEPGVVLLAMPDVCLEGMRGFLEGFDRSLDFSQYLDDPVPLAPAELLCKAAAQLCYMSFGPKRTMNVDVKKYFDNIKESGHGSVLEHANFTFLLYGISRSVTHELVRHRAGFGFSQVSQRYVSGKVLRFVERPEYTSSRLLHGRFIERIDRMYAEYHELAEMLLALQKEGTTILSAGQKTDLRKKVQQAARSCLANETEAPIFVTGNARAWRHVSEMRASAHAEVEIRAAAMKAFLCLRQVAPIIFDDYDVEDYPDGTQVVITPWRKV